jgi:Tol biopolymer transport system component
MVGERSHLVVVDAHGRVSDWTRDRAAHNDTPRASPDGTRAAYALTNAKGLDDIWIAERGGASKRRVVAMQGADCVLSVWSPDGKQIAFARIGFDPNDGVYVQSVDGGAPTRICRSSGGVLKISPLSWSPDGGDLLAVESRDGGSDIVRIATRFAGDSLPPPVPLLSGPGNQSSACFSPDGRWIAFCTDETGENEVYVAPYRPGGSLGTPLAVGSGGPLLRWSRSGSEVFFFQDRGSSPRSHVMSVSLKFHPALSASAPVPRWDLDSLRADGRLWDILPGDQLLLVQRGEEEESNVEVTRLACVFNFFDELRQKLRAAGKR